MNNFLRRSVTCNYNSYKLYCVLFPLLKTQGTLVTRTRCSQISNNHHQFYFLFAQHKSFWRIPVSGVADVSVVGGGEGATSRCKSGVSPACLLDSVSWECPPNVLLSPQQYPPVSPEHASSFHLSGPGIRTLNSISWRGSSLCVRPRASSSSWSTGQFSVVVVVVVTDEELSRGCTELQGCHPFRISLFVFCLFQQSFYNLWSPDHLPEDIDGEKWS